MKFSPSMEQIQAIFQGAMFRPLSTS